MTAESPADAPSIIRNVPLLARLSDADIRSLSRSGTTRSFQAGQVIFREGDEGDSVHVVIEGEVRVGRTSEAGEETTIAQFKPGDCFGEFALFDGLPRSATAVAVRPTRCFVVRRASFVAWLNERPQAALILLETLSLRLRRTSDRMTDQIFLDLSHRLVKELIGRAQPHAPGSPLEVRCTQAELGAQLGVSRESVNKTLRALERRGLLQLGRGRITIPDVDDLRWAT